MTAHIASRAESSTLRPAASFVEWAGVINRLAVRNGPARQRYLQPSRGRTGPAAAELLLTAVPRAANSTSQGSAGMASFSARMAPEVAEHLVAEGLDPDFLSDLAAASGLESRDVLDFVGIDRTTVSRRKASGSALPPDAAIKALQAIDLVMQATEVFGAPAQASAWLTRPHPALEGETPFARARTPWGMGKVQSMLVALRYGGAV